MSTAISLSYAAEMAVFLCAGRFDGYGVADWLSVNCLFVPYLHLTILESPILSCTISDSYSLAEAFSPDKLLVELMLTHKKLAATTWATASSCNFIYFSDLLDKGGSSPFRATQSVFFSSLFYNRPIIKLPSYIPIEIIIFYFKPN